MNGKEESRAEPHLGHFILRSVLYIIREGEGPVAKRRDLSSGQTEPGLREGRVRVGRAVGWSCGRGGNLSAEGEYEGIWGGGCSGAGCHSRKTPSILYFFFLHAYAFSFHLPDSDSARLVRPSRELMGEQDAPSLTPRWGDLTSPWGAGVGASLSPSPPGGRVSAPRTAPAVPGEQSRAGLG